MLEVWRTWWQEGSLCRPREHDSILAIVPGDCEWAGTAPGQASPANGNGRSDLNHYIVGPICVRPRPEQVTRNAMPLSFACEENARPASNFVELTWHGAAIVSATSFHRTPVALLTCLCLLRQQLQQPCVPSASREENTGENKERER